MHVCSRPGQGLCALTQECPGAAFNLGAEFCGRWTTSTSTGFFDVTVALIELASQVGGDVVDASKLWTCRLAVVSGKFALARETGGGQGQVRALYSFSASVAVNRLARRRHRRTRNS